MKRKINKKELIIGILVGWLLPSIILLVAGSIYVHNHPGGGAPTYCSQAFECGEPEEDGMVRCKVCMNFECTETREVRCNPN